MNDLMLPVTFYWAVYDDTDLVAIFSFDRRGEAELFAVSWDNHYEIYPAVIQGAVVVKQP